MTGFTSSFGGSTVDSARTSYVLISAQPTAPLNWPGDLSASPQSADVIDTLNVTSLNLPDATLASPGQDIIINNQGPGTLTVNTFSGSPIVSIPNGTSWVIYLQGNLTQSGVWGKVQLGAYVSVTNAAALAGAGLSVIGAQLDVSYNPVSINTNTSVVVGDRAKSFIWQGTTAGFLTLPNIVGLQQGWFINVKNNSSEVLTLVAPSGSTLDMSSTLVIAPGDGGTVITDLANFYTIGFSSATFVSTFASGVIDVSGQATHSLTAAEAQLSTISFIGTPGGVCVITAPITPFRAYIENLTSDKSLITIGVAAQAIPVSVENNARMLIYCDGIAVKESVTSTTPLDVVCWGLAVG